MFVNTKNFHYCAIYKQKLVEEQKVFSMPCCDFLGFLFGFDLKGALLAPAKARCGK